MPEECALESYERDWSAEDYLCQYYREVGSDERINARFAEESLAAAGREYERALEFGCGPTVHHAAVLAPYVQRLDLSDYLPENLAEVRRWLMRDPRAHDWESYLATMLFADAPDARAAASARAERLRAVAGDLLQGDVRRPRPVEVERPYELVASYYCLETAARSRPEWRSAMRGLADLVAPGGMLLLTSMRRCRGYRVLGRRFATIDLDEHDFRQLLPELGFQDVDVRVEEVPDWREEGFDSICCVRALRETGTTD